MEYKPVRPNAYVPFKKAVTVERRGFLRSLGALPAAIALGKAVPAASPSIVADGKTFDVARWWAEGHKRAGHRVYLDGLDVTDICHSFTAGPQGEAECFVEGTMALETRRGRVSVR